MSAPATRTRRKTTRAEVVADLPVSLDGCVAGPPGGIERVFRWCSKPQPTPQPRERAAGKAEATRLGAIVYGLRNLLGNESGHERKRGNRDEADYRQHHGPQEVSPMNAPKDNTAAKGLRGWWLSPPRTGMQRLIVPWEYRHLRAFGVTRIAGGSVAAAAGVICLSYGVYGWAAFFVVLGALNLAGGSWYLTIGRSASART